MKICAFLFSILPAVLIAAPQVTEVRARQNWPWDPKVYIDYTLTGADKPCNLDVKATWRGQSVPLRLAIGNGLVGSTYGVTSGTGTLVWDPREAGEKRAMVDAMFTVNAVTAPTATYLVFDLKTGDCEELSEVPAGGWTTEHKTVKMVFRRVPAGTFTMGITAEQKAFVNPKTDDRQKAHTIQLTSDYYLAIFPLTASQYKSVVNKTADTSSTSIHGIKYNDLRGMVADGINWPISGYAVTKASFIGQLRAVLGSAVLVDLPTEAQWERAARAESDGLYYAIEGYPGGGTIEELGTYGSQACLDLIHAIASTGTKVGTKLPNKWGIYDTFGLAKNGESCLDWGSYLTDDAVDPVGGSSTSATSRMRRGYYSRSDTLSMDTILLRRLNWDVANGANARMCIHLKKLVD